MLAVCFSPVQLLGDTILYNNFGPGDTFLNSAFESGFTFLGTTFTTTGAGPLGNIRMAGALAFGTSPITAGLYANSSGEPGQLLESWDVTFPPTFPPPVTTLASVK